MNIHTHIYKKLTKLGVIALVDSGVSHAKSEREPYMPLSYDRLYTEGDAIIIALAHNYTQNGDLMADPDMQIRVIPKHELAEALTYQQDSLGIYQEVYPEPGKVAPRLKKELNRFLNQWLNNAIEQGHQFTQTTEVA